MKSNLDNKILLQKSPIRILFLKYAIPSLITVLFFGVQSIVDGIIVGNYIGAEALAGINIILPFYSAVMVVAIIMGIGSQIIVSIGAGEGDWRKSQDAMTTGFISLTVISIFSTIFIFLFAESFTTFLGADKIILPFALNYLKGLLPFIFPLIMCFYSDSMLKALGHPKLSMFILSFAVILNIILSILFVVVFKLGIIGASIATGIAFTIAFLISATITFSSKQKISMLKGKFRWIYFWKAAYNGSSEGVSELASAFTILFINLTVIKLLGTEGVAAFTAINYINFIGVLIFLGISDGIIPVLSYNYGAKNYARVKKIFKFVAFVNGLIGLIIFILLQIIGNNLIQIFFDKSNSNIIEIANQGLSIYSYLFLIIGFNILITSFFTSLGNAKNSIIIALLRGIVFLFIGLNIFPHFFSIGGVWATVPISELLTLIVALILFRKTLKKLN